MDEHDDFYRQLRGKVTAWLQRGGKEHRWAEYVLAAPDIFHLLCKLVAEPEVPVAAKVKLAGAIAYFISPIDLLPEGIIGPIGYLDDLALAALVLNSLLSSVDEEVLRRHWAGEGDLLELLQRILALADQMLGRGLLGKLRKMLP